MRAKHGLRTYQWSCRPFEEEEVEEVEEEEELR